MKWVHCTSCGQASCTIAGRNGWLQLLLLPALGAVGAWQQVLPAGQRASSCTPSHLHITCCGVSAVVPSLAAALSIHIRHHAPHSTSNHPPSALKLCSCSAGRSAPTPAAPCCLPPQEVLYYRGLAACMSFPVEFTRAMRQAAVNILVKLKLPELTESADSSRELWLHLLNCLVDFEVKLAPLLGIPVLDKGSLPLTLLAGGALERLCSEAAWLERWLDSEQSSMRSQLDEVLYSDSVWEPPAAEAASEDGGDGGYGAQPVWRQEFYPPQGGCAGAGAGAAVQYRQHLLCA